jgi:hypothetical protein
MATSWFGTPLTGIFLEDELPEETEFCTIILRVTALRTHGRFELPPFPEDGALASELAF